MGTLEEMIAVAKSLESKIDKLIELGGVGSVAGASADAGEAGKTKTTRKPKEEKATPSVTADQLKARFDEVKEAHSDKVPALKKLIADQGYANLAELLTHPEKFDAAMQALNDFADAQKAEPEDDL